jgi:glutamate racemase
MTILPPDPLPPSGAGDAMAPTSRGAALRIGVFDSGVGGLSVLQAIRGQLAHADLLYVADSGHAPYGDRGEASVCDRARRIAAFLHGQGAGVLVVACNTATAAAVAALRECWPALAIVGVEPGIKPAVAMSTARRVGVLATTGTLASDKFHRLATAHAGGAALVLQACPGLADAIEAADADESAVAALVERYCEPLRTAGVDVAVLGCTHYVFARAHFARSLPGVTLLDTAAAVARQTARLAQGGSSTSAPAGGRLLAWSSGDPGVLSRFAARWLGWALDVQALSD